MTHSKPLAYTDEVETVPPDEANDIERVAQALKSILAKSRAKTGQFRADVHVKTHGYALGEFRVLPSLPEELAQGLFEREVALPAVVRFSNAAPAPQPDAIPDARGMAIKVLGVSGDVVSTDEQKGKTQDFVMINHPVFFARNVKDFLRVEEILAQGGAESIVKLQEGLTGGEWNPLHWHWREMLTAVQIAAQLPAHPASNTYFSMSPFRFGKYVAKFRAKPVGIPGETYVELIARLATQPDAMRLALEETLRAHSLSFEFQVQLRTSEQTMPIEDATIEWPESESPYRTVAQLQLPRQEIASLRLQPDYKALSFNVWHALSAHRPLGGINRARRTAYPLSAAWRRKQADAPVEDAPGKGV
jgi:catalase